MSPASSLSDGAYVLHWGKETFFLIFVIDNNDNNFFSEDMFTEHYCRWDRYTGWDLLSLTGLLAWIFYFKQVRLKQHQNPYPWPPTVYQDLGIFEKV